LTAFFIPIKKRSGIMSGKRSPPTERKIYYLIERREKLNNENS